MYISISAALEAGNRVAVKHGKDEYFVGTVVKSTPTGVKVKYDDNGDVVLERGVVVRLDDKMKLRKKSITAEEVKGFRFSTKNIVVKKQDKPIAFTKNEIKPAKVTVVKINKTTKQVQTVKVSSKKTVTDQDVVAERTKPVEDIPVTPSIVPVSGPVGVDTISMHFTGAELTLQRKILKEAEYLRYGGGNPDIDSYLRGSNKRKMLTMMGALHLRINKAFFGGKLSKCELELFNNSKKVPYLGMYTHHWNGDPSKIQLHPRLFISPSPITLLTVMAHEMAHQYVAEVQKIDESSFNRGHGPNWKAAMAMCGLPADVYASQDSMNGMKTPDQLMQDKARELARDAAGSTYVSFVLAGMPATTPVQWYDTKEGKWVQGISCGPEEGDFNTTRTVFVSDPYKKDYRYIPNDWLYLIPRPANQMFQTPGFMIRARQLIAFFEQRYAKKHNKEVKAEIRRNRALEKRDKRLEDLDRELNS